METLPQPTTKLLKYRGWVVHISYTSSNVISFPSSFLALLVSFIHLTEIKLCIDPTYVLCYPMIGLKKTSQNKYGF